MSLLALVAGFSQIQDGDLTKFATDALQTTTSRP
jgi:hypothetical protein